MFHLAPVGLPTTSRINRCDHYNLEHDISVAIQDINKNTFYQFIVYNQLHPDTKALLKSLDAFFSHGLNGGDKCYWCFVQEFIPATEKIKLSRLWNCKKARALSVAWLKDSLNKSTLHFQMLAFLSASSDKFKFKWYNKNACLYNRKVLEKICESIACLEKVEFNIEVPFVFHAEDVPIALPMPILTSPAGSISSNNTTHHIDVVMKRPNRLLSRSFVPGSCTSMASISDVLATSHLSELTENLTEVKLPLSASKPFLTTKRDQNYIIDELVQSHRKRANGYFQSKRETMETLMTNRCSSIDQLTDNEGTEVGKKNFDMSPKATNSLILNTEKNKLALMDNNKNVDDSTDVREVNANINLDVNEVSSQKSVVSESNNNLSGSESSTSRVEEGESDLSDVEDDCGGYVTGIIPVDSGEIVHLAMEIFRGDGERFQKLFQIFTGHSAGQPVVRYMAVTDQFIYFLSNSKLTLTIDNDDNSDNNVRVASSSFSESAVDATFAALRNNIITADNYKYVVHTTIALSEIDYLTVGIDAQVFCIHLKKHKTSPVFNNNSNLVEDAKQQNCQLFSIDSGSKQLTKTIIKTLQKTFVQNPNVSSKLKNSSSVAIFTHSTQMSMIIKRFLKQELELPNIDVIHHSLVYWIEMQLEDYKSSKTVILEGYLDVRNVNLKSWMRRVGDWQYSYFVFV